MRVVMRDGAAIYPVIDNLFNQCVTISFHMLDVNSMQSP